MRWNGTQRTAVHALAIALLCSLGAVPIPAAQAQQAAQRQFNFNIPAKSVPQAVNEIGRISGLSVVFPEKKPISAKGSPVHGSMSAAQALSILLAGTGLSYRFSNATTVMIVDPSARAEGGAAVPAGAISLDTIDVQGAANPNSTMTPAPNYAGGQVASGGRVGFLGNRSIFDTPFTQNNYTEKLIRDQQALSIVNVFDNAPGARSIISPYQPQPNVLIRGFPVNARDFAFDGLYGIVSRIRPAVEGTERVEIMNGPGAFLYGFPPSGSVAGVVNLVPKRATDTPITRITGQYLSESTGGGAVDFGRRFGDANEFGVRINGAYRGGQSPIMGNNERYAFLTAGFDYRGDRFRASFDVGHTYFNGQAVSSGFAVSPGLAIPEAPSLRINHQPPWANTENENTFAAGRAEYDLTNDVTVFAAAGGSINDIKEQSAFPNTITNAAGRMTQAGNRNAADQDQWTVEAGIRARFATGFIDHSVAVVGTHLDSKIWQGFSTSAAWVSNLYSPVYTAQPNFTPYANLARTTTFAELDGTAITDTMSMLDGRLQLIGGGRFQRAYQQQLNASNVVTRTYDETAVTPMGAIVVKPIDAVSLYASYAEGFGFGPSAPATAANPNQVFPPVVTKQIETGAKVNLGNLGATIAFYEISQPASYIDPVTNVFGLYGEQRTRGMDFNLFGEVVPGFRVLGGFSALDGRLVRTDSALINGNVAPGVPDIQLNLGAEVDLPAWIAEGISLNARVIHTSKTFYDRANTQIVPEWTRVDLGARYTFVANNLPMTARFTVLNVAGENYWGTGFGQLVLGTPLTFLFSLSTDLSAPPPVDRHQMAFK